MPPDYNALKVLAAPCRQCGAAEGERCRTKTGKRYTGSDFHVQRKGDVYPRFMRDSAGRPKRGVKK
jgi:hypothetical protein